MSFQQDLRRGGGAQSLVIELLNKCGFNSIPVNGRGPDRSFWDITTTGNEIQFTTEIKFDEYEARSGNIAIETHNPRLGKPSGLGITKAFFWAHVLSDGAVWLTQVDRLKIYVEETEPKRTIGAGGDGNATLLLYQSGLILPAIFTRIDGMNPEELLTYIREQVQ